MRLLSCAVAMLFSFPLVADAGIYMTPVITVSTDTTDPLATVTVKILAGSDSGSQPITSYSYTLRMDTDIVDTSFQAVALSYTTLAPSVVTGSVWGSSNFTTLTATNTANSFTFTGVRAGTDTLIPAIPPFNDNVLLGTAVFTTARPSVGAPDVTYNIWMDISPTPLPVNFTSTAPPSSNVQVTFASGNFTIAAQTAAAVPEPASTLLVASGLGVIGWRRLRRRNR
jgi:hypothetical protein